MERKPILGILLGDGAGVGPEIIAKLAAANFFEEYCHPVFIGDIRIFNRALNAVGANVEIRTINDPTEAIWDGKCNIVNRNNLSCEEAPIGELTVACGKANLDMLIYAVELYKAKKIEGFCFGPLNKAGMKEAGCKFESEHHLLAHEFNHTAPFGEINVCGELWTTRTTSHIPIKDVSAALSVNSIMRAITLANVSLKNSGIERPRLAIAALNPHCGENGLCGREEIDVIKPAIEEARKQGIDASGPYPSDITFIKAFRGEFDGVVTMYHDQGQIALKLKGFEQGITIAGGLPAPIVTCAHGTAYDIAGKGIVKTSAFENAVKMAARMANHLAK
ncbi:PdxA family protein [Bullifex porci]|uniref:PdxA family dehydrogenase n=1 Tax=Bullifex porci TaxID=2606638 RepID=UPI0023EFD182|nr:4-hydroxythreonine-4-phosphate dehydrogenase PdxA [Bullifex porci]MDD7256418.1 4-hydroxythreonine-4-phosphate dehydrogenase PdxA [Bullifex porci]MDY2741277.1 4-hydroxythreonine-4-phosphate dehydrogenase PdxA [Bullifex porci]